MKRILLLALLSLNAHAQFTDTQKAAGLPNNALSNPGFESGLTGWAKSGGNWSLNTANAAEGKYAIAMQYTAVDQTLKSALTSIPRAIVAKYGGACMASFVYLGGGGNTYEYYVEDSSSNVVGGYTASQTMFQITADATSDYARSLTMSFTCDEDQTYRIVIKNKTASTQTLYVDNAVLGGNDNIGTVAQAEVIFNGSRNTAQSIGATGPVAIQYGTVNILRNATQSAGIITVRKSGTYQAIGFARSQLVGSGVWSIGVEKNNIAILGCEPLPNVIPGESLSGTIICTFTAEVNDTIRFVSNTTLDNSYNIDQATTSLTRFPTSSETVARLDAPGVLPTTYTPTLTGSSNGLAFTNQTTTGSYQCSGGVLRGWVRTIFSGAPGTGTGFFVWSLPAGFTIDTARMPTMNAADVALGAASIRDSGTTFYRGVARYNSTTNISLLGNDSGNEVSPTAPMTVANADTIGFEYVVPVTDSSPCPKSPQVLIPGSVYSSSAGVERINRARINNNGSVCSTDLESGDWISSLTYNGTGDCTLVFTTGIFSATPVCVVSGEEGSAASVLTSAKIASLSSTGVRVRHSVITSGSSTIAGTNNPVHIICSGDR